MGTSCCHTNTVTNTDEERTFLPGKPTDKPPILRIDDALAQYYKDCYRNDYFDDESGQGKFREYANETYIHWKLQLEDDVNDPNDCYFVQHIDKIDPMFPLPISTNESRANDIFQVLKHCYKYGVAPLVLNWQHITNALKHELYDNIASTF
eukprot:910430_1